MRLVREDARGGEERMRLLVGRLPAALEAPGQVNKELERRVAERTAELSEANASLTKHIAESAQAERRLAAEHAVASILAKSARLTDAAPKILQAIAESLGWDVGVFWALDQGHEVLLRIGVWHAPMVALPAFARMIRQRTLSPGIGMPGRVWASDGPVWIPDVTQDATFQGVPFTAEGSLHAAIGFPIRNGIGFVGVMEFFSLEIRKPDEELLQTMTSICCHVSQFIERMRAEKALFLREAELRVATKIQRGLIPKVSPPLAGFDIAGVSHCAAETGGDFFDFFPLLDGSQGLVIADASGHGLGPALLATETRAYLRALSLAHAGLDRTVALVNRRLVEDVGDDHFVTLILARLDPRTHSLAYTNAGHPCGCVVDPSGGVKAYLKSTGPLLGVFPEGDFPIGPATTLGPGDLVLFLTDGVIDARASDGTSFGFQRAIDIVHAYRGDTAAQIVFNLYHAVRAFAHNQSQLDDITAVVIKALAAS
jgi:serine phosphatase RsbU (regulator of sigma subunit)